MQHVRRARGGGVAWSQELVRHITIARVGLCHVEDGADEVADAGGAVDVHFGLEGR